MMIQWHSLSIKLFSSGKQNENPLQEWQLWPRSPVLHCVPWNMCKYVYILCVPCICVHVCVERLITHTSSTSSNSFYPYYYAPPSSIYLLLRIFVSLFLTSYRSNVYLSFSDLSLSLSQITLSLSLSDHSLSLSLSLFSLSLSLSLSFTHTHTHTHTHPHPPTHSFVHSYSEVSYSRKTKIQDAVSASVWDFKLSAYATSVWGLKLLATGGRGGRMRVRLRSVSASIPSMWTKATHSTN